jgi:hypothetical protein
MQKPIAAGLAALFSASCSGATADRTTPTGQSDASESTVNASDAGGSPGTGASSTIGPDAADFGADGSRGPPIGSGSNGLLDGGLVSCALPAGVAARWLAFDSAFTFEADGAAANRNLFLARADGSGLVQLTNDTTTDKEPAFSSTGTLFAFASDRTGLTQIYVMVLATGAVTQLTSLAEGADQPSWSKDDTQIVFHVGESAIYIMGADGSNQQVVVDSQGDFEYPILSPDGTHVVADVHNGIDTMNVDGTGLQEVVSNATTTIETATFLPDGVTLGFAVKEYGAIEQLATVPYAGTSDGNTATTVTSFGPVRRPAWGPANAIAFEYGFFDFPYTPYTQQSDIALTLPPGDVGCAVVTTPGSHRDPVWAPAGFQPPSWATIVQGSSGDGGLDAEAGSSPVDSGADSDGPG